MVVEELIGKEITHKTFGLGTVVDVAIDYTNLPSSKIKVEFENKTAKFLVYFLNKVFLDLPEDLMEDILRFSPNDNNRTSISKIPKKKLKPVTAYEKDENDNILTRQDWELCKRFITSFWWTVNKLPSPVVKNDKKVYITAKAACEDMGVSQSAYSSIYSVCNGTASKSTFNGSSWRFATIEDIESILKALDTNE